MLLLGGRAISGALEAVRSLRGVGSGMLIASVLAGLRVVRWLGHFGDALCSDYGVRERNASKLHLNAWPSTPC